MVHDSMVMLGYYNRKELRGQQLIFVRRGIFHIFEADRGPGIDVDGAVGVVDDHAGLGAGGLFELLDGGDVHGQNVAVDVTPVKQLRKPAGAKPGMVIYHTYNTVFVNPYPDIVRDALNSEESEKSC